MEVVVMEVVVKAHKKKHGGTYYTVHASEGRFKQILGRYKKRLQADAVKRKFESGE